MRALPLARAMAGDNPVLHGIPVGEPAQITFGSQIAILVCCVVVQHLGEFLPGDEDAGMKNIVYLSTPLHQSNSPAGKRQVFADGDEQKTGRFREWQRGYTSELSEST